MRILPINNYNSKSNVTNLSVNFEAALPKLIPLDVNSFKTEIAKKTFSRIHKYMKILGDNDNVKNIQLGTSKFGDETTNLFFSIIKKRHNTKITLTEQYKDNTSVSLMDIVLDKNGQMVIGDLPSQGVHFERISKNHRTIDANGHTYLPIGNNDKEWECYGRSFMQSKNLLEETEYGVQEIFLELARLKTSLFK